MPRTFDRRFQPALDKDPNRFGTDYSDPFGAIGDAAALAGSDIRDNLVRIIKETTGIDLTGVVEFLDWLGESLGVPQLVQWFQEASNFIRDVVGEIVQSITGAIGGTLETLGEFFGGFIAGAGNLIDQVGDAIGNLGDVVRGIFGNVGKGVSDLTQWFLGLLGFGGFHAAGSLLGTGQLGKTNPEMLINGSFDGAASMPNEGIGGWVWDGTVDHTGTAESGSAKVIANGTPRSMLSNAIEVTESNQVDASVWVKWTGRTGTGPVSLVLNVYAAGDVLIDTAVFETAGTGSSSDWIKLDGSCRVPELIAGKTPVRVCAAFLIDENVTAGTFWWDDASMKKTNPMSHTLVDGFQDAIEGVTEQAGAGLTDFVNALKSFDRIQTGTILDDFIPGIGRLIENGVRGILGLPPPTGVYTHEDFLAAAGSQAESITGNGASITTIWQYLNAGVYDEFERTGSSLGANWATPWGSGNGTITCEGHNAAMPFAWPGGNSEWSTRWTGTNAASVSDYQQVSVVLSSAPGSTPVGGYDGSNFVLARVGGSSHYIKFRVSGNGAWAMTKIVNSVEYAMTDATTGLPISGGAGSIKRPGPGSVITLYAGDKATTEPRRFRVLVNNATVCDFIEKVSVSGVPNSVYGSSYRSRGFGLRAEGLAFLTLGWVGPGLVNYWSSSDQP